MTDDQLRHLDAAVRHIKKLHGWDRDFVIWLDAEPETLKLSADMAETLFNIYQEISA